MPPENPLVVQPWLGRMSLKAQTVVLQMLRGPDSHYPHRGDSELKKLHRFIRRAVLFDGGGGRFMRDLQNEPDWELLEKELDYTSSHYLCHLIQALHLIALNANDQVDRQRARAVYDWVVAEFLHLEPESDQRILLRLA